MNPQPNVSVNPVDDPLSERNPMVFDMPMGTGQPSFGPIPGQMFITLRNSAIPQGPYFMHQGPNMSGFENLPQVQTHSRQIQLQNNRSLKLLAPYQYSAESSNQIPCQVKRDQFGNTINLSQPYMAGGAWQPEFVPNQNHFQYHNLVGNWVQPQYKANVPQLRNYINQTQVQAINPNTGFGQPFHNYTLGSSGQDQTFQNQPFLKPITQPPAIEAPNGYTQNKSHAGQLNNPSTLAAPIQNSQGETTADTLKKSGLICNKPGIKKIVGDGRCISRNSIRNNVHLINDKKVKKVKKLARLTEQDLEFLLTIFCPFVGCTLTFETIEKKRAHIFHCQFKI